MTSKMQDIQNELEKCLEEKKAVLDVSSVFAPSSSLVVFGYVFYCRFDINYSRYHFKVFLLLYGSLLIP